MAYTTYVLNKPNYMANQRSTLEIYEHRGGWKRFLAAPRSAAVKFPKRQMEVLLLVTDGVKIKTVGLELGISGKTVAYHMSIIYKKAGVVGIAQLTRWAIRNGLIEP